MPPKRTPKTSDTASAASAEDLCDRESLDGKDSIELLKILIMDGQRNHANTQNMFTQMKARFDVQINHQDTVIFDLQKKNDALEICNTDLNRRLSESESKISSLETLLNKIVTEHDDLELSLRRPCLVVNNLKPEPNTSDEELFIKLCKDKEIDAEMCKEKIAKIHRIPRPAHALDLSKPQGLIVKFSQDRFRDVVFTNKKKLKGSGIVISELLTKKRSALLKRCIEKLPGDRTEHSIWTDSGKILVKYGREMTRLINNEQDLAKITRDFSIASVLITGYA